MTAAKPSKLAPLLEKLFANPSPAWSMLPSGAEIKCKGIEGEREILVRRVGSRPGDVELKTFAKHAGFEDWHVFWLANQVAWLIEVCPDGQFYPDEWLEASGKAHLVVRDQEQPSGNRASPVKSFVEQALAKTVQPDPEDAADYLESVQAAEEITPTLAELDAILEPTMPAEAAREIPETPNADQVAVMVSGLLEFGQKHGWPGIEIGPGVRLVGTEDGWRKFVASNVASNTGYQISRAHTAALAIDPAWFKLGGRS